MALLLSDILYYIRLQGKCQAFFECEFALEIGTAPKRLYFKTLLNVQKLNVGIAACLRLATCWRAGLPR